MPWSPKQFVGLSLLAFASTLSAQSSANVLVNPGFESGVGPWVPRGGESVIVSTQAHTGASAAWVTNRTAGWQGPAQSLLGRVRAGGKYFCATWARSESATPQTLLLSIEQRDEAGTRYFNVASATVTNNTWTFLSGTFSLDIVGALSDVLVYVEGPAAGIDLRVDDVAVVPLSGFRHAAAQGQRSVLLGGVGGSAINTDIPFGRVVGTDYHIAGTENALKFSSLHPGSNTYSFAGADAILDHGTLNGQLARGHTLVWHDSVPNWVATNSWTPAQLQAILFGHVDTVVSRYR
ncbi:MAG TPA: carbohydrate binding domain-containing protein, partial [Candidatus Binatia bacterium]|nr:carbohydrate binding domain-containing protein [Candidatus Binatia bacterium]